jgi:hypothetical protein
MSMKFLQNDKVLITPLLLECYKRKIIVIKMMKSYIYGLVRVFSRVVLTHQTLLGYMDKI